MLVEARNLSFFIKRPEAELKILQHIDLTIDDSELVAVQGPSGSGKTTLLHILGTLLRPTKGEVLIEGVNPYHLSDIELAHFRANQVGFIFQQFHVFPNLTLLDNILIPTSLPFEAPAAAPNSEARVRELAKSLGISNRLDHYPHQVSGGQLQRLVIARALIRKPRILFADEPTGNLDSKTAREIISILHKINSEYGQAILLVTHDQNIADELPRKITIIDGRIEEDRELRPARPPFRAPAEIPDSAEKNSGRKKLPQFVLQNIRRNLRRSLLTMLGIFVGISATFFLGSMGSFVQEKILDSYKDLGVSAFRFHAYPNWPYTGFRRSLPYAQLNFTRDIAPMRKLFPEVDLFSPLYINWSGGKVVYGGKSLDDRKNIFGVATEFFDISSWKASEGTVFNKYHEKNGSDVCLLGATLKNKLFGNTPAAGVMLEVHLEDTTSVCRVLGVLEDRKVGSQWDDPNDGIFVPYTSFPNFSSNRVRFMNFLARVRPGADVGEVAPAIEDYFKKKYGTTGEFRADKNSLLLAQMQKFTNLMRILLLAISFVCLVIGGVGLMNMMLVSVAERLSELGLLRALGASAKSLSHGVLLEALVLCSASGVLGVLTGFGVFHGALWLLSKLLPKVAFEWHLDYSALVLSLVSMVAVALLSAYLPAKRASELEVLHAIKGRSD